MRKLIRTPNKLLEQICRRLEEKKYFNLKEPTIPKLFVILKQNNNRIKENIIVIEKIKIRGFTVSHKSPDNCILLKDDRILLIKTLFYYVTVKT